MLKTANVKPRMAPPKPKRRAVKPESATPLIELKSVGFSFLSFKKIENKAYSN